MTLKHYWVILRPSNCFMAGLAACIGYWVSLSGFSLNLTALLLFLAAFLVCGAGQTINDFFDREVDKKIRPHKPIPAGKIRARSALVYANIVFILGILCAYFVNLTVFSIAFAYSILLFLYSSSLAKFKFIGNLVVAGGTALTLVFGASATGNYSLVVFLALIAFFANYARELIKDLEDLEADKGFKKSLPMYLASKKIKVIIFVAYSLAVLIALSVAFTRLVEAIFYFPLIFLSVIIFFQSFRQCYAEEFTKSQELSKYGMIIALIAFLTVVI